MDFTINTETYEAVVNSFERIARKLLLETIFIINNKEYQFVDIEFYFNCPMHQDNCTHEHTKESGQFRPHQYGVDIALKSENGGYGGILLKGLKDLNDNAIITKTRVKDIFIDNARGNKIEYGFEKRTFEYPEPYLIRTKRLNLGQRCPDFINKKYRFLPFDIELIKKYKGKEQLVRDSDIEDEKQIKQLLGYTLRND